MREEEEGEKEEEERSRKRERRGGRRQGSRGRKARKRGTCTCIHKKAALVGPDKPAIPGQCCFKLVSSHQQGMCITCLAHHLALLYSR